MACVSPIRAWSHKEYLTDNGKKSISFSYPNGYLHKYDSISIPCGKCEGCRSAHALMWAVRCYHESTQHLMNSFITLTYDDEHLPVDGKINKRDLQLFFKRLRKKYKFRYFAVGEYGEATRRPHYHAIIFGQNFMHDKEPINEILYTSETLAKAWGKGLISVGEVNIKSIMYAAGYAQKKIADPDTFNLMSRKPAIGTAWLNKYKDELIQNGFVVIDGQKFTIPKHYIRVYEEDFSDVVANNLKLAEQQDALYLENGARGYRNKKINMHAKRMSKLKGVI